MKVKIKCKCCGHVIELDEDVIENMAREIERKHEQEYKKEGVKSHFNGFQDLMNMFGIKD